MRREEVNARFWRTLLWECAAGWRANVREWLAAVVILTVVLLVLRIF